MSDTVTVVAAGDGVTVTVSVRSAFRHPLRPDSISVDVCIGHDGFGDEPCCRDIFDEVSLGDEAPDFSEFDDDSSDEEDEEEEYDDEPYDDTGEESEDPEPDESGDEDDVIGDAEGDQPADGEREEAPGWRWP